MTTDRPEPDIKRSNCIAISPEEIWNFLYDVSNEPQWREGVKEAGWVSDPPHGVGSNGLNIIEGIGDWPWTVTESEEPHVMSWVTTGGRFEGAHAGYCIAPEDAGSRVTIHMRVKPSVQMRIIMLIMKRRIGRQFSGDLERLKAILEA